MDLTRRTFLKVAGAVGATSLVAPATARAATAGRAKAVLVDTTLCVGCRGCEAACAEANGLPDPVQAGDPQVFAVARTTGTQSFTVVNQATCNAANGDARFAKTQCLHCVDPACVSACPVRALEKQPEGPVTYTKDRCIGCRYCMVACPFGVPRYEYEHAIPYVRKCEFCWQRQAKGLAPACVSACPSGALQLGTRDELLEVARTRIYQNPDRYLHQIYGEHEAGGTSWLYLTDIGFDKLRLPQGVSTTAYPELTKTALAGVPVVMTLWPPLLMAMYSAAKERRAKVAEAEGEENDHA